jgi:hypothetical protein
VDYPLQGALDVINITYPRNPFIEGTCTSHYLKIPVDLFVYDDNVYIADIWTIEGPSNIYQIDVSDPSNPRLDRQRAADGNARAVFCRDDTVYLACMDAGLGIFSLPELFPIGLIDTYNTAIELFVLDDFVYISDFNTRGPGCLTIINITDINNPNIVGQCRPVGDDPFMIHIQEYVEEISDDFFSNYMDIKLYAYVADKEGLTIMDVTNPEEPFRAAFIEIPGQSRCVYVEGNYAFVASGYYGLAVIDISEPTNPSLVGHYNVSGFATGVFTQKNFIYVPAGNTLHVLRFVGGTYTD